MRLSHAPAPEVTPFLYQPVQREEAHMARALTPRRCTWAGSLIQLGVDVRVLQRYRMRQLVRASNIYGDAACCILACVISQNRFYQTDAPNSNTACARRATFAPNEG